MISEAHQHLRAATQAAHERLEARMDILQRIATPNGRRTLVERFHALHTETETALAPWLTGVFGLDFDARRRSARLAVDLAALGGRTLPRSEQVRVGSVGEALGRMYVLEGSTLGGRVIRRTVLARGHSMGGLSFLDPYGEQVGERWRTFLAVLDAQARRRTDLDAMTAGALAGFRHAETRLCGDAELV